MKKKHTLSSTKILLLSCIALFSGQFSIAQSPVIEWQKLYRATSHPTTPSLAGRGEDWFYDISNDIDPTSGFNTGFLATGYTTQANFPLKNPEFDELESCALTKGEPFHKLARLDNNGNVIWYYVSPNRCGYLKAGIEDEDGNYLVVGFLQEKDIYENEFHAYSEVYYNPTTSSSGLLIGTSTIDAHRKHSYVAKFDREGNKLWEYIYGMDESATDAANGYGLAASIIPTGHTASGKKNLHDYRI
jgi:hypothetical protein